MRQPLDGIAGSSYYTLIGKYSLPLESECSIYFVVYLDEIVLTH